MERRKNFILTGERFLRLYYEEHPEVIGMTDADEVSRFFRSTNWKKRIRPVFDNVMEELFDYTFSPEDLSTGLKSFLQIRKETNAEDAFDAYMEE